MKYYATRLSENISETPEGFLLCVGVSIARTGDMEYGRGETPLEVGSNGKVIISRSDEEVFRKETIASFEGKTLTIQHPDDFVSSENWKELSAGHIQNVRRGEGSQDQDLVADILITDRYAISLVKDGLRGLSCGYEAEYEQTGDGTGIQKNIVGNHLALVEEGRAGSKYAIKDHKGDSMSKLEQALKMLGLKKGSKAAKAIDEAMKEEEKKAKDAEAVSYDELVKIMKDVSAKIEGMKKSGDEDESKEDEKEKPKDEEVAPSLESRLEKLEAAVAKLLERESKEDEVPVDDEDEEEMEDEKESGEEKSEDEDKEDSEDEEFELTGDTKSRAEILAPGIEKTKDVKVNALKAAYKTEEGKKVIDSLTGGKMTYDSAEKVNMVFTAASEILKEKRSDKLSKTKTTDFNSHIFVDSSAMTPEKMNEINSKRYNVK